MNSHVNVTASTFKKSDCRTYCNGVMSLINTEFIVENVSFEENTNKQGTLYATGNLYGAEGFGNRKISGCTFKGNWA
jgi:hypothetical protein